MELSPAAAAAAAAALTPQRDSAAKSQNTI